MSLSALPWVAATWCQAASPAPRAGSDSQRTVRPGPLLRWRPSVPVSSPLTAGRPASGGTESRAARRNTPSPRHRPGKAASTPRTRSATWSWRVNFTQSHRYNLDLSVRPWVRPSPGLAGSTEATPIPPGWGSASTLPRAANVIMRLGKTIVTYDFFLFNDFATSYDLNDV